LKDRPKSMARHRPTQAQLSKSHVTVVLHQTFPGLIELNVPLRSLTRCLNDDYVDRHLGATARIRVRIPQSHPHDERPGFYFGSIAVPPEGPRPRPRPQRSSSRCGSRVPTTRTRDL